MKYWTMRKGNREIKVYQRWKVLLLKLVGWKVKFYYVITSD